MVSHVLTSADTDVARQFIFFLVPTVALAAQQEKVVQAHIPAVGCRCISGRETVDTWSIAVWKAFLDNTRIVISTYQVLLDALKHGFVRIDQLGLVVIDEGRSSPYGPS